jgi:hypothetical protein
MRRLAYTLFHYSIIFSSRSLHGFFWADPGRLANRSA